MGDTDLRVSPPWREAELRDGCLPGEEATGEQGGAN